jgi:hypothetical protein
MEAAGKLAIFTRESPSNVKAFLITGVKKKN